MEWRGNICVTEPDGSKKVIIPDVDVSGSQVDDCKKILREAIELWIQKGCPLLHA